MWWEISNQRAAICWHWKWQKWLQIWHRHRNLRTKKWSAEMIKIDFVTMAWPSLGKNMTWSNRLILITRNLRTRPDHKEGCQDQATTCRIAGTEFWNGRGIRRAWQSGSDTQQMCNTNCFFSSCPLCLIFLEKVGNPFCELFRTRAWPSRFHTKQKKGS